MLGNATAQYTSIASLPVAGGTMSSLACYWQNLAVSSTPYLCGGSGGTAPGSPSAVKVIVDQQLSLCSGTGAANCAAGGVPSNPLLEPSNVSAPSLQAVLAFNLTGQIELIDLIAGLLDNTTGGLNGSLVDMTSELPTLGLNSVVWAALANATWGSSGTFGDPVSLAISTFLAPAGGALVPNFDLFGILTSAWNTVSGAVLTGVAYIAHGIVGLLAVAWNAVVAVATYLAQLGKALVRFAETAVAATVAELQAVGAAMEQALSALVQEVVSAVDGAITSAIQVVEASVRRYAPTVVSSYVSMDQAVSSYLNGSGSLASALDSGSAFGLTLFGMSGAAASIQEILSAVSTALQPILQFVSLTHIIEFVSSGLGLRGPLGTISNIVNGAGEASSAAFATVLDRLMRALGLGNPWPSSVPVYGYFPSPSHSVGFLQSVMSEGTSWSSSFLSFLLQQSQTGQNVTQFDEVITGLATAFFGAFLYDKIVTAGFASVQRDDILAIALTIIGLILFVVLQDVLGDILSIAVDTWSIFLDAEELAGASPENEVLIGADVLDLGANFFDIFASGYDIGQAL